MHEARWHGYRTLCSANDGQIFKIVYGYLDQGRVRRTKNDDEVRLYARKCEESVDESYTL